LGEPIGFAGLVDVGSLSALFRQDLHELVDLQV
jgi:hypothetical protein